MEGGGQTLWTLKETLLPLARVSIAESRAWNLSEGGIGAREGIFVH